MAIISRDHYHPLAPSRYANDTPCFFSFYIFFLQLADGSRGGSLEVRDFKKRAKEGESYTPSSSSVQTSVFLHRNQTSGLTYQCMKPRSLVSNPVKKRIYSHKKVKPIIWLNLDECKQFLTHASGSLCDTVCLEADLLQLGVDLTPGLLCKAVCERPSVLRERCHMVSRYNSGLRLSPECLSGPGSSHTPPPVGSHNTHIRTHTYPTHTQHTHRPLPTLSRPPSHLPVNKTRIKL